MGLGMEPRAMALGPVDPDIHLNLAIAYEAKGALLKAKGHFAFVNRTDPGLYEKYKSSLINTATK